MTGIPELDDYIVYFVMGKTYRMSPNEVDNTDIDKIVCMMELNGYQMEKEKLEIEQEKVKKKKW